MSQHGHGRLYRRSLYCLLHWEGPVLFVRNCNTARLFRGAERYFDILQNLGDWTSAASLAATLSMGIDEAEQALEKLVTMELVQDDRDLRTDSSTPQAWNLVDLALQRQTSRGGFDPARARTGPAPPAFKPSPGTTPLTLRRDSLDHTVSLRSALEARRSIRTYAPEDLTLDALGVFLHSAARVTGHGRDPDLGEYSQRPYPGAGARHALEIYPVCNSVAGVDTGAYYYHPRDHLLYPLNRTDAGRIALNREVHAASGGTLNRDPAVVLVVTAVFERIAWKYQNIALSLILKDLGCLYQTMYLVATGMGLAPCGIGGGKESENARWLGLDPMVESQVGAFLLGHPATA